MAVVPSSSLILITLIEGDSMYWPGLEVEELCHVGESIANEVEAGFLEDALAPLFKPEHPGTYFLWGFQASYHKDYWGEVDADFTLGGWRAATPADEERINKLLAEDGHT